jgi:porin
LFFRNLLNGLAFAASLGAAALGSPSSHAADFPAPSEQAEPGLFGQRYLTGNWGGARDQLAAHGVILDIQLTQFYQGLLSGTGDKDGEYGGKADYF